MTRTPRLVVWLGFVLLLIAVNYTGRAEGGKPPRDVLYQYDTAISGAIQYAVLLAIVVAIAGASGALLALRRPRSWSRALGLALAVIVGILVISQILDPVLHPGREQGLTPPGWEGSHAAQYVVNGVVIAIVAPFVEELTFRGIGYTLLADHGRWTAIVVTGVLFGLSHGLVDALPVLAIFGCGLAWLRSRTDSVYPGMLVHGVFNAIALAAAVAT